MFCEPGARAFELQGTEFPAHRRVQLGRRPAPGRREVFGRRPIVRPRRRDRLGELSEPGLTCIERRDVLREPRQQCGQRIHGDAVLAARGPQREEPLLHGLKFARVAIGRLQRILEGRRGAVERHEDQVEGLEAGLDQVRRLDGAAFEAPQERRQGGGGRAFSADALVGVPQVAQDLLGLLHDDAPLGKALLFPGLGSQLGEFRVDVVEIVGIGPGLADPGMLLVIEALGRLAGRVGGPDLAGPGFERPIGIEQGTVGDGVDQRAVVVLAMDFDQTPADVAQRLGTDRCVVEESAGAAVRQLQPAQDEAALGLDVLAPHHVPGRVVGRDIEHGRDLSLLLALAHRGSVAAAAERQREGIEQDRFAGTGLPGQHRQARPELKVEPVDQYDVPDTKLGEHGRCPSGRHAPERGATEAGTPKAVPSTDRAAADLA